MWFAGVDLQYLGVELRRQGPADARAGRPATRTRSTASGACTSTRPATSSSTGSCSRSFGVYARIENRDALVTLGSERIYVTKEMACTAGVRVVVNSHIVVKAEYLHNDEYGGITEFDNDVFTSSLVLSF